MRPVIQVYLYHTFIKKASFQPRVLLHKTEFCVLIELPHENTEA